MRCAWCHGPTRSLGPAETGFEAAAGWHIWRCTVCDHEQPAPPSEPVAALTPEQSQLANYMSDLSELAYCAGWMDGLEYALWAVLQGPDRAYGMVDFTDEQIARLRALSEACGGWIYWHEGAACWAFMPIDQWRERYARANDPRYHGAL